MNKINLENRVAIVTGGAQGFGLAITKRFIESGAKVLICDKDAEYLNKVDLKNTKKIEVSYLDNIIGSSRSIDTIKYLLKIKKPKNLYLIIGSDILLEFHKWKNWKKIVKLTKLILIH